MGLILGLLLAASVAAGHDARGQAARAPQGALHQLAGAGACLGTGSECGRLRGPEGLDRLTISPDGRNLYLTGQAGGLAVLARDPRTGRLHQLPGAAGCLRRDGRQSCARVPGLVGAGGMALAPDGRSLYVTTAHGVLALARDSRIGKLRVLAAIRVRGMDSPTELIAAGSRTLYVAGTGTPGANGERGALGVLARQPSSGRITQLAGTQGCLTSGGGAGCAAVSCLEDYTALVPSRDGGRLYAGATDSLDFEATSPGVVASFSRSADGGLTYLGCVHRNEAISGMAASPSDDSVFALTLFGNRGTGQASSTIDRYVPGASGALDRQRQLACFSPTGCPTPLDPSQGSVTVAPPGHTLYVALFFGGVGALRVGRGGALTPLSGRWRCVVARSFYMPPAGCNRSGEEIAGSLAVSSDGRNLYVGTLGDASGSLYAGGVETFSIQR